ncbi:hypothetical protein ACHHYP_05020 [Achlya hypogyna]|uniref:Uncharacterized protein n=1 Tax=Achlya hypogyna TaxID=1202772 RepID=A0A1V9YZA8_ACHHY|nr:hypothetical protein ACHHYP_05020 [Achlya hypogyna]
MARCKCKARKCLKCEACIKCQCYCNGTPVRKPKPATSPKPHRPKKPSEDDMGDGRPKKRQMTMDELLGPRRSSLARENDVDESAVLDAVALQLHALKAETGEVISAPSAAPSPTSSSDEETEYVAPRASLRNRARSEGESELVSAPPIKRKSPRSRDKQVAVEETIAPATEPDAAASPTAATEAVKEEAAPLTLDEELKEIMDRREAEEDELAALEKQIFELEGAYLRRNQHAGNIAKGWAPAKSFVAEVMKDQLVEVELSGDNPPEMAPAEADAVDQQRIFSFSSLSSPAELLAQKWLEGKSDEELFALQVAATPEGRSLRKRDVIIDTAVASSVSANPSPRVPGPKPKGKRKKPY